jgi:hypothetical protein
MYRQRVALFVLLFVTSGLAACSGDDSAALPLPEAGPTPTDGSAEGAAREAGSADAGLEASATNGSEDGSVLSDADGAAVDGGAGGE